MIRRLVLLWIVIAVPSTAAIAAEPDRLKAREDAWQAVLERSSFEFSESDAGVMFSLSQFSGNCQIRMIYDPARWWRLTFRFVRDGKELVEIEGHTKSVFRAEKNILYFAHFQTSSQGCVVTAHDLETGKKLWETKLNAIPRAGHSGYSNEVTMSMSSRSGGDNKGEGVVYVVGRESFGDYMEVLDLETGKVLAHKIYKQR